MLRHVIWSACFGLSLCVGQSLSAAVRLPDVLSNGMVMQRERPVPVWGQANPGENVTVEFAGQKKQAAADADGKWRVLLAPMPASATGREMVISGENTLRLQDVMVGEVWVCSGQSNMDFELKKSIGGEEAVKQAGDSQLRLYFVPRKIRKEGEPANAKWRSASPESVPDFSAVGYYFGRDLKAALKVPVGLIHTSWGGTQAEAWTPREYIAADPDLKPCLDRELVWEKTRSKDQAEYDAKVEAWKKDVAQAKAEGKPEPAAPRKPDSLWPTRPVASMYRSMLSPVLGYGARGVLWYQGEANAGRAWQYRKLLPTMIRAWREQWPDQDLWFGIIQMPNIQAVTAEPTDVAWSHMRDAQLATVKSVPKTGLVVTIDLGEVNNVHPVNKAPVGQRASQWALADVYGLPITRGGPTYQSMQIRGGEITIKFIDIGKGIKTRDGGPLREFTIAGEDKKWVLAKARIEGPDAIVVSADGLAEPKAVRYAWSTNPKNPNLTNDTDIPATPFRTDDWPGPTDKNR